MLVETISGEQVSIVSNKKTHLIDSNGNQWVRNSECDTYNCAAFTKYVAPQQTIQLTKDELVRVCKGDKAINTPVTVAEMRDYSTRMDPEYRDVIDQWPDQKLREMLADAEESGRDPGADMHKEAEREIEANNPVEKPTEALPEATEAHRAPRTARSTPRPRKQEGSVSVALGEVSVLLTPKQLEFMERLSECPGWEDNGPNGEYIASEYTQELSDTMNPMSVGAVLTTLREKHLLQTEKRRIGAIKCCAFKLTDLGVQVYNKLAGKDGAK